MFFEALFYSNAFYIIIIITFLKKLSFISQLNYSCIAIYFQCNWLNKTVRILSISSIHN